MKRWMATFAWMCVLAGCSGSAEIGSDVCSGGDDERCHPPMSHDPGLVDSGDPVPVVPESLVTVMPISAVDALAGTSDAWHALWADRAGTLWEFAASVGMEGDEKLGDTYLHVRTTTLEGERSQGTVEPPAIKGVRRGARADQLSEARASQRGPVLDLTWSAALCASESDGACGIGETLAFGAEPSAAPERTRWSEGGRRVGPAYSAQAKNRWITVEYPSTIEQRTRSLELVWRQSALYEEHLSFAANPDLLEDGALALVAGDPRVTGSAVPDYFWRVDFDGHVQQHIQLATSFVTGTLAHDTRNRVLIAGTVKGGDIYVLRIAPDGSPVRRWAFFRTEYSDLSVLRASVDMAGTLYVLTKTGPRDAENPTPVVCRVRENDEADCVKLAWPDGMPLTISTPYMQATAEGSLYVSDGARLLRYELPER